MPTAMFDAEKIGKKLINQLRNEVAKSGHSKVVLGLSGGVDSALVCHLAAAAFGGENVLTICMPYRTSNPDSERDARRVAEDCKVQFELIPISPMVDAYFASRPDADMMRRGNYMSRTRMAVLFDHSALHHALVLGTSNKTELLLGYGTIHGDMASAINPLGGLYKSQVWQLSQQLEVAQQVIDKTPSADLWEGQSDEQELGFSYADVDRLLYRMIDLQQGRGELIAAGFAERFIDDVCSRIDRYSFKRRLPLILSV